MASSKKKLTPKGQSGGSGGIKNPPKGRVPKTKMPRPKSGRNR